MAIKPLVLVFQELRQPTANIINPTLSGCVIGPHYHIKTYAEHKEEILAGTYDVAAGTSILAFPAAVPGMKLKSEGFKVWLDNARALLASGSAANINAEGQLTGDVGEDFTSAGDVIKAGDTVRLEHDLTLAGAATGDGDGANPERILMDTTVDNIEVGDTIVSVVGAPSLAGAVITDVQPTYIVIDPVIGAGVTFASADITIKRVRLIQNSATGQTFAVQKLDGATGNENILYLTTNAPFVVADNTLSYAISRRVSGVELIASNYTLDTVAKTVTIAAAGTITVDSLVRTIIEYDLSEATTGEDAANIYLEYTALDVTYANIPLRIEQNSDLTQLGVLDGRNPLGLGAFTMFGNSQSVMYAIGLDSEDAAGWALAVDAVNRGQYYAQALLTQDDAIAGIFLANNLANEVPEIAQYGMTVTNADLPETIELAGSDAGEQLNDVGSGLDILFEDTTADFLNPANPVAPGDLLNIGAESFTIDVVINANRVKILASDPFSGLASGVTYTITRALSKDQQAASVAASSEAFGNKRLVRTYPNLCEIAGVEEPGYYLNCVVAGMISGLPSQAGITNKGAAVIEKVINTNWDYFTESQLDVIAQGGTLLFVQEDANSIPFIRHQLTTDVSLLETAEISVVKNNDFLSLFFKGIVKPFLGEWNVTEDLLTALRSAINAGIELQKGASVAKIGPPLIDATLESLAVSDISPDRVEIYLSTTQPKPLNTIGLHLIL